MAAPLDFYFDFSSPYAYIGAMRIEALAAKHGRGVNWHPMLLGVAFKIAGTQPLTQYPLKGDYSRRDFDRSARELGVPFNMPANFPVATQAAARGVFWLQQQQPDKAAGLIKAIYTAYFVDGRDISSPDTVVTIAESLGIDGAALRAGFESAETKAAFKLAVEQAVTERGVFGAPFVFADGEPFWGADRFDMLDRWLTSGGW
ncbi:2-hydroxychromene-2-carboxylate isomerase [Ferrovibrio sp.]|uniref:2-hydroxychromene-2-carboxylate isomerase n=1 Tax=Ferrovibrio sp. TaxID=1917215 RepID=UPI003D28EE8B